MVSERPCAFASGLKVRVFAHDGADLAQIPILGSDAELFFKDMTSLDLKKSDASSSYSASAPNKNNFGGGRGLQKQRGEQASSTSPRAQGAASTFMSGAFPNFVFDAKKTKSGSSTQWLAKRVDDELHLFPARSTFSFDKRVKGEADLQAAMQKMKEQEQRVAQDLKEWDETRKNKSTAVGGVLGGMGDAGAAAGALLGGDAGPSESSVSKRPYVRTGCAELDEENKFLSLLEDPSQRAAQKFSKEDASFKKKRKLLQERMAYSKMESNVPETAVATTFLKRGDDDEYDWDGEENDRFSDDEGNDGGEDDNIENAREMAGDMLADEDAAEKDAKYQPEGKDGAEFDRLSSILKREDASGAAQLAQELDELSMMELEEEEAAAERRAAAAAASSSGTGAGGQSAAGSSTSAGTSVAEVVDRLFETRTVVSVNTLLSSLGIVTAADKQSDKWKDAKAHLKKHYTAQKNNGQYVFTKKVQK
ncbi:unnamed protein product [Amoebophrya sp. A25]|nr:unnamed protein product [Amoebophrya sp. A25]|eukprot:GSA25T00025147001.1